MTIRTFAVVFLAVLAAAPQAPAAPSAHPAQVPAFGVMLGASGMGVEQRIAVARTLGVRYVRPNDIRIPAWRGADPEAAAFAQAGFGIVLTVRNAAAGPLRPAAPPADLAAFQRAVGEILDTHRPALLVVENEENSALFYRGTPQEYGAELRAACAVARARRIPCTNGGLVSGLVALLVYEGYREDGDPARAEEFARRAFTPSQRARLNSPQVREQVARGRALLGEYRAAGADYLNFHWYIADPQALREAAAYLRRQTGLPLVTNEIGQHDDDPRTTTALLHAAAELGLPYVVWFSIDAPQARALMNPDGTLRPPGQAFRAFLAGRSR
ncbi:MAG: hypothetical protein QN141_12840 [Armatimonadota bacterium]|nr:hypothetical protein [Armatimonadota bacterium]MDR7452538.1 hypothetical protein [Armatimonadota bacterium]MDR7467765.1 hypothetical protein [Armatimonadota bacterium]MDR7494965.1 hypothetical protein [Armatimonadota bacterium]MDR7499770.1 hypothetical protein [Armatimonadota bacterium]